MKTLNPKAEYIVKNGKPTAVIMPIAEYEELLEDLHDFGVIARRKDEPTIPLAEVKRRLKTNAGKNKSQRFRSGPRPLRRSYNGG